MIREQRAPSGPRPDISPTRQRISENYVSAVGTGGSRLLTGKDSTLNAPPRNNHTVFTFGSPTDDNSGSYDFLPSPSFDDLQTSISNELQLTTQFPAAGGDIMTKDKPTAGGIKTSIHDGRGIGSARGLSGPRPARTSSFQRRQSLNNRQSSISSTASTNSGNMEPSNAPLAMRNRRQNQYPPISGSAAANAPVTRAPRRSVGGADVDYSNKAAAAAAAAGTGAGAGLGQRRRPSLAPSSSIQSLSDAANASARANNGPPPSYTDGARGLTAARAAKTKSLQPPAKSQPSLSIQPGTPDHSRSSSLAARSPARTTAVATMANTPSSAASKRMSIVPGSHATGLGARTMLEEPNGYLLHMAVHLAHRELHQLLNLMHLFLPSLLETRRDRHQCYLEKCLLLPPRELHRTLILRQMQAVTRLELQVLCNRDYRHSHPRLHDYPHQSLGTAGNNEEEDVPPVPAIPKAYESPKDSPSEPPFFAKRKTSMPFETSSINSTSTNSISGRNSDREHGRNEREPKRLRHAPPATSSNSDLEQKASASATPVKKKNLKPLRLPPLNLLPLSNPTATKAAAISNPEPLPNGAVTPPPRRVNTKTPSSPMTASKTSFFSRRAESKAERQLQQMRRNSSIYHGRPGSVSQLGENESESKPIPITSRPPPRATSPYLSTSLPKHHGENVLMPRSKTSGDFTTLDISSDSKPMRLTGPRALKVNKLAKSETPAEVSSPEEPPTPSSATSLRRKLSLGWKRSGSKATTNASHAANERESNQPPPPPKHDNMPPPKLPASATMNNMNSNSVSNTSPSAKATTTYLNSSRRKSSVSSLTMFTGHTKSDSWGLTRSPKKEASTESVATERNIPTSSSRTTSSVMHKMLNPKSSSNSIRHQDHWTADLDKDDLQAEEETRKLGLKRKETEHAARLLDALRKRATPKDRVPPQQALKLVTHLNIYERGEIVDYKDIYFCGTANAAKHVGQLQSDAANFGYDDDRGDYQIAAGDHLAYRYEIIDDPKNKHSMVNFVQSFYFRGHLCISTELLDMNLYELIKSNSFRGFSLKIVRRFTKQMLSSLLLLKSKKVIHCDLKPENILLAHPLHSEIKVIDFGSSCFEHEKVYTYIQSRFYRSPEVILGMTYGLPIDMWSLGCILAELYTGVPIFPGENEQEQLACIMEVFGPPEKHLIEKSTRRKLFFDSLGKPRLTVSSKGRRRRPSSKSLQQVLKCDDEAFLDFLARCLRWDPDRRMKPDEAVRHEFISGQKAAPPRMLTRIESPIKRHNTTAAPSTSTNRPLPEPPATSYKTGTAVRAREATANSPSKALPRRQSNVNAVVTGPPGPKRTSTGGPTPSASNSSLPRVTRSVSAKQDLASAGATAAMSSRRP
ncbi:dual specificity kinase pom1 protein [Rutstroemia sp. NJR-2017a BBW]|nr:dual specificity kinase pom1 protein [Rutstroemia sp. NJR-2017a BBW]